MKQHKYQKFKPKWCDYDNFAGINYCWGLAGIADKWKMNKKKTAEELKRFCKNCECFNQQI